MSKGSVVRPSSSKVVSNNVASFSIPSKNLKQMVEILTSENTDDSNPISYFVIDEKERVQAFLRNRDTNYINLMNTNPELIRIGILGAMRFNKQLIFDLMDNELLIESLEKLCAEIEPSLFKDLFNGQIRNEEKFTKLIKESDGELYKAHFFVKENMTYFKVILLLSKPTENDYLLKLGSPYRVIYE